MRILITEATLGGAAPADLPARLDALPAQDVPG